jgi:hypothetical protein
VVLLIVILCTAVLFVRKRHHRERGFEVKNIHIEGNRQLKREEILAMADVSEGVRLLENDEVAMHERLMAHTWIEAVRIKQEMGGTLVIAVKEHTPIAILRRSAVSLLCIDGTVIPFDSVFADLPTVYIHGKMDFSSVTARIRMIQFVLGEERGLTIHFRGHESTFVELDGVKLMIGSNEPLPLEGEVAGAIEEMKEKGYRICDMRFKDQIIFEKGGAL